VVAIGASLLAERREEAGPDDDRDDDDTADEAERDRAPAGV